VLQVSVSPGGVPNRAIPEGHLVKGGIKGDGWRHPTFHGGPERAILLMTAEGIDELRARGFPLFYGALGENITSVGLDRRALRLGQRFQVGTAVIELTRVRTPCATMDVYGAEIQEAIFDLLALRSDSTSPVWGMSGFYASVVTPGVVRPGDPIQLADACVV
jgi:MOSC domain-containing protein YiiM